MGLSGMNFMEELMIGNVRPEAGGEQVQTYTADVHPTRTQAA